MRVLSLQSKSNFLLCSAVLLTLSCGDDDPAPTGTIETDEVAPAPIHDLEVSAESHSRAILRWTAPGDDDRSGRADRYEVRYSAGFDTAAGWWGAGETVANGIGPAAPGERESLAVGGLADSTTYRFAVKTGDEVPNWSALSNVATITTPEAPDTIVPGKIADLRPLQVTESTVELTWAVPDDPAKAAAVAEYSIRYDVEPIDGESWPLAARLTYFPPDLATGEPDTFTVTRLDPLTTYYFAVRAADHACNWSAISNVAAATTSEADPQRTVEGLLDYFAVVYSQMDSAGYGRILDEEYDTWGAIKREF